jgi:hypothetical protein
VAAALALISALVLTGCGSKPGPAKSQASARTKSAPRSAGVTNTQPIDAAAASAQAVFQADSKSGKDPFFPSSKGVLAKASDSAPGPRGPVLSYLKLVGIRPGTHRPMALINRTPFAPGEEGDVAITISDQGTKAETHNVAVRCLEIRHDSVLISIAGEQGVKELRMAKAK